MEFYLYLNPSGSSHTLSHFVVVDPPELGNLKGSWECALIELSMVCDFTPKSDRLYLCGDFLDVSFVNQDRIQLLRNIEVRGKYKKYLTERYLDRIYVPVIPGSERDCHVIYANLKPDWFIKIATASQSVAMFFI